MQSQVKVAAEGPFKRPSSGPTLRLLGRHMPPPPTDQVSFGFPELRERTTARHYLVCAAFVALNFSVFIGMGYEWKYLDYNFPLAGVAVSRYIGTYGTVWGIAALIANSLFLWWLFGRIGRGIVHKPNTATPTRLGAYAVLEEQWFRQGSENWTIWQRIKSCVIFALLHVESLIYPMAWILVLPFAGTIFMTIYRRIYKRTKSQAEATFAAALYHRAFNVVSLGVGVSAMIGFMAYDIITRLPI